MPHLYGGDGHPKLDQRAQPSLIGVALNVPLALLAGGIPAHRVCRAGAAPGEGGDSSARECSA